MTTTSHRRALLNPGPDPAAPRAERALGPGEHVLDAGVRAEVRAVVGELVDSAAAQAREAGRQLRCIHRLWLLAWEDREIDWISSAGLMPYEADERSCSLLETEDQLVRDVADEIGPALALPAGTALDRVREALVLGLHLPEVLEALEAGRFSARHASVIADQWRELVEGAPLGEEAPAEAVRRLAAELVERAPHCTVAQLRAWSRRRRAALLAETHERRHRAARAGRRVWVEHGEDGMALLHALLDAPTALAVQDRLDALVARLEPAEGSGCAGAAAGTGAVVTSAGTAAAAEPTGGPGAAVTADRSARPGRGPAVRTEAQLRADVLADLLLAGEVLDDPSFPRDVRSQVSVAVPVLTLLGTGPALGAVHADAPVLTGHGPISAEVARELAAGASSWHRVLTHPVTGVVLDHDRTAYAVPAGRTYRTVPGSLAASPPGRSGRCRPAGSRPDGADSLPF